MSRQVSLAEGVPPVEVDCMQMYKLVVSFKEKLSKMFSEKGLMVESTRLNDFKTLTIESQADRQPPIQQMSSNVVLVFQLIVELIHTVIVSKPGRSERGQTEEKCAQTDEASLHNELLGPDWSQVSSQTTTKHEQEEGNAVESCYEIPAPADMFSITPHLSDPQPPPPQIPVIPLRKSLRSSVLNRKPFITPRQTRRKSASLEKTPRVKTSPAKKPSASDTCNSVVTVALRSGKSAGRLSLVKAAKPLPAKATGAKKRKLGPVSKTRLMVSRTVKKEQKENGKEEEEGEEEDREQADEEMEKPLKCHPQQKNKKRRAGNWSGGLATSLYQRTSDGRFQCLECGKVARLQTNIRKHLRKHTGEKPYQCTLCPVAFAYPRSLKRHQLVHEGVRPYQCPECGKCFFDPTSLRTHRRVHTDDRPFVCQVCGNRFRQKEGLKGHMRIHTGDRPFVCERCGMAFSAKRSLTRHIRVHTGERPYSCDQCVAAFADWTTLHNHKLVHRLPEEEGGWGQKENSGEGQDGRSGVRKEGSESELRPHQCQFCGVRYRQPLSLKRHLRLHSSGPNPNPAPVPKRPSAKRTPRRRVVEDGGDVVNGSVVEDGGSSALHMQYRPYQCQVCGERFKHLRGYHTHCSKHQTGTLKKPQSSPSKRLKQEVEEKRGPGEEGVESVLSVGDSVVKQVAAAAGSILTFSVAVHNTNEDYENATAGTLQNMVPESSVGVDGNSVVGVDANCVVPQTISLPQHISIPSHSAAGEVHSITIPHSFALTHSTRSLDSRSISLASPHGDAAITTTTTIPYSISSSSSNSIQGGVSVVAPQTFAIAKGLHHSISIPVSSAGDAHHPSSQISNSANPPLSISLLPTTQHLQQSGGSTVTIIDASSAFAGIQQAPSMHHLPVVSSSSGRNLTPVLTNTGELIHFSLPQPPNPAPNTTTSTTQLIQYPDGTLGEVTTLLPPPLPSAQASASTITLPLPPTSSSTSGDLLDSVVTVVFETQDGTVILDNH